MADTQVFTIRFSPQAKKDIEKLTPFLKNKLKSILTEVVAQDPYEGKRLRGDLSGSFSLRLTYKDRIVYHIDSGTRIVYIERARTHYGD